MQKMTSSTSNSALARNSSPSSKSLTDFSIDSIIGRDRQKTKQQSKAFRTENKLTNNSSRTSLDPLVVHPEPDLTLQGDRVTASHLVANRKFRPKNFRCPACKMAFSNKGQLTNHIRIHTGERPFICNHVGCHKTFTRNEELTRHKLIHTGIRPHACTSCGKRFGRKDHLKKHLRTHERKRMRKKVFMQPNSFQTLKRNEDMFLTSDFTRQKPDSGVLSGSIIPFTSSCSSTADLPELIATTAPSITIVASNSQSPLPLGLPLISAAHGQHIQVHRELKSSNDAANSSTIQQLASDYWYNLLGIYQQQNPIRTHIESLCTRSMRR